MLLLPRRWMRVRRLLKVVWVDAETIREMHRMRIGAAAIREILRILGVT